MKAERPTIWCLIRSTAIAALLAMAPNAAKAGSAPDTAANSGSEPAKGEARPPQQKAGEQRDEPSPAATSEPKTDATEAAKPTGAARDGSPSGAPNTQSAAPNKKTKTALSPEQRQMLEHRELLLMLDMLEDYQLFDEVPEETAAEAAP